MDPPLDYSILGPRRLKRPPTRIERWVFRLLYWLGAGVVILVAFFALWMNRVDVHGGTQSLIPDFALAAAGVAVASVFAVFWLVRILIFSELWFTRTICLLSIVIPCVVFTSAFFLIARGTPFYSAFSYSRPALERAVSEFRADPAKAASMRWAGVFQIKSISTDGTDSTVVIAGSEGFDTGPYLHWSPGGGPPKVNAYSIKSLGHDWYWVNR